LNSTFSQPGEKKSTQDQVIQDLINKREFQQAESLANEKIRREPDEPDGYYFKGVIQYFQGQIGPTIENLKRALSLDPRHTDAAICLSVLYNDIGRYGDAKGVFDLANQSVAHRRGSDDWGINKKFAVKHLEIADLYFRYRRYDEAIEEYSKAILLDPTSYELRIRRAKSFAKKGFVTRALQELQQLKHEQPDFLPARIQLGMLHYSQGNVLDAEIEWESTLDIEPTNRDATAYLEMAKQARSRPQEQRL
jgi:tetratricopeptide (TPR) repeat protein